MRDFWYRGLAIVSALVVVCLLISVSLAVLSNARSSSTATSTATATTTATTTASPSVAACDPKFVQVGANNADGKVDGDFEQKYAAATSKAANLSDAQKQLLLTESANNAQRLAIWANAYGLYANPNDWNTLSVNDNCLSAAGQILYYQFEGALNAKGTTFAEGDAPATGYNSGVNGNGTYQVYAAPGVTGNRKAIKVTLPNGTVVWIMIRCGNVVYSTPPPGVPTTTPPTTKPPTKPPTSPPTTKQKVPSQDPAAQGNAPVGGGKNIDPGPGVYVPPAQMSQPPAVTRVNPAPPPVVQAPPVNSVPDPVPAPAPQPAAPKPAAPATGCAPAPGMTTC
jgi:hypothetical protein